MSKIIAICGATGNQGGAVVNRFLNEPGWQVRALTRDTTTSKAQALQTRGASVVAASFDDVDSMVQAFEGATVVYAVTNFWNHFALGPEAAAEAETQELISIATAASRTTSLQHFIISSSPSSIKTAGHFTAHMDGKDRGVDAIKAQLPELAKKMTVMFMGLFSSMVFSRPYMSPFRVPNTKEPGTYSWMLPAKPDAIVPFGGDIEHNIGVFVKAILDHPERSLPAKYTLCATDNFTLAEALDLWSNVAERPAALATVTLDGFANVWGAPGREIGLQYVMHDKEPDFLKAYREDFVEMEELGIRREDLVTHEQVLERNREKLTSWQ